MDDLLNHAQQLANQAPTPIIQPIEGRVAYLVNQRHGTVNNNAQQLAETLNQKGLEILCIVCEPLGAEGAAESDINGVRYLYSPLLDTFLNEKTKLEASVERLMTLMRIYRPMAVLSEVTGVGLAAAIVAKRLGLLFYGAESSLVEKECFQQELFVSKRASALFDITNSYASRLKKMGVSNKKLIKPLGINEALGMNDFVKHCWNVSDEPPEVAHAGFFKLKKQEDVYSSFECKSSKYKKIKDLNAGISKQKRANEFNYLVDYASALRAVQMTETYVGLVGFIAENIRLLTGSFFNEALKHIRSVFLVTADPSIFYRVKSKDSSALKKISLPESVIDTLPIDIKLLLRKGTSVNDFVFDAQEDLYKIERLIKDEVFKSALDEQKHGIMLNYFSLLGSEKGYLEQLNYVLESSGLEKINSLSFEGGNVLKTIQCSSVKSKEKEDAKYPLVSIIMACYESEKTVDYALRSILNQSYKNIEVLVCDDGSQDASLHRILEIARSDARVKVFKSRRNQGTYNIRNSLLEVSQGEYITFQDADDWSHPQRIEQQLLYMQDNNVSVCSARWIRVEANGKTVFFVDGRIYRFCVVSTMVKKEIFNDVPKFRQSLVAADTEFHESCIQLLGQEKVKVINKPLILGLWGDGSLTKKEGLKAENNGHVAQRRREYSDIASRQRVLGANVITDVDVDNVLKKNGIYRDSSGIDLVEV